MHVPLNIQEWMKVERTSTADEHDHPSKAWFLQELLPASAVCNPLATGINPRYRVHRLVGPMFLRGERIWTHQVPMVAIRREPLTEVLRIIFSPYDNETNYTLGFFICRPSSDSEVDGRYAAQLHRSYCCLLQSIGSTVRWRDLNWTEVCDLPLQMLYTACHLLLACYLPQWDYDCWCHM
jgi:hypothetical protein